MLFQGHRRLFCYTLPCQCYHLVTCTACFRNNYIILFTVTFWNTFAFLCDLYLYLGAKAESYSISSTYCEAATTLV